MPEWSKPWPYHDVKPLPLTVSAPVNQLSRLIRSLYQRNCKDWMLISLPRSGSDWLMEQIVKANPCLRYHREFFNPICNVQFGDILRQAFGAEMPFDQNLIINLKKQEKLLSEIYKKTWVKTDLKMTKENWVLFKLEFLARYFDFYVLYRHRRSTFPGKSHPELTLNCYQSLYSALCMHRSVFSKDVSQLIEFSEKKAGSIEERCCASHIIGFYVIFKYCRENHIPVMSYEKLITCENQNELTAYLAKHLPAEIANRKLTDRIIKTADRVLINKKHQLYDELNVEKFCTQLLNLIHDSDELNLLLKYGMVIDQ